MRIVCALVVLLASSALWAQEAKQDNRSPEQARVAAARTKSEEALRPWRANIPATLEEAHMALERLLSPETLADIDAMPTEGCMIEYHFSLGLNMRNGWGLWAGSPLAQHLQQLGVTHPDDMSGAILKTFWRRRHGRDLWVKAAKTTQPSRQEEELRAQEDRLAIQKMMMGLRFEKRDVPTVRVPVKNGLSVRFLCPLRKGVFLTAHRPGRIASDLFGISEGFYVDPEANETYPKRQYDDFVIRGSYWSGRSDLGYRKAKPGDDFYTQGFYLDLADHRIHRICVAEVNEVYAAVAVGGRAWFAGLTSGKAVLLGVGERDRITVPLPLEEEIPDLGMDGQTLLAVYSKKIFRLTERQWALVHSGDILLPRSGLPPQLYGNMVLLRDEEGRRVQGKRLWWLALGEQLHLHALDRNVGVVGESGPRWENSSSYCMTSRGDLWACVGDSNAASVLRHSKDGTYSIAIMNNSAQFSGDLLGPGKANQVLSVSAVTALSDDVLLLAGRTGLYRLKDNELIQDLAFASEEVQGSGGGVLHHGSWNPNTILVLDERSYVIGSDSGNGVCLLRKETDGKWTCPPLEDLRDTVVW